MVIAIRKKAQEVSFVLLRVAGYIKHKELAGRIESISYQLIESLYSHDFHTAITKTDAAIGLISLANNVGDINSGNANIILRELENLKNGIQQLKQAAEVRETPNVEGLFTKLVLPAAKPQTRAVQSGVILSKAKDLDSSDYLRMTKASHAEPTSRHPEPLPRHSERSEESRSFRDQPVILSASEESKKDRSFSGPQDDKAQPERLVKEGDDPRNAAIRQEAILAKIRQMNGQMKLKEIIAAFPNTSERTLRYDLVKLCQINKLTREGSGGPSNYYAIPVPNGRQAGFAASTTPIATPPQSQPQTGPGGGVMNNSIVSL